MPGPRGVWSGGCLLPGVGTGWGVSGLGGVCSQEVSGPGVPVGDIHKSTAAGSMHPTVMHSCDYLYLYLYFHQGVCAAKAWPFPQAAVDMYSRYTTEMDKRLKGMCGDLGL